MLLCPNWGLIQPAVRREAAQMSQRLEDQAPDVIQPYRCGNGWQGQDFPWHDALKYCKIPSQIMPYMRWTKKEKGCERLVCGTLHLVYFDWQDGGEKKDRTVFLLSYGSRTGDFFSFQMMTTRKGPRLFSKYNILVIQIARGVMKDGCLHAC